MAPGNQIRILCVDDHPVLREGIAAILTSEAPVMSGGEALLAIRKEFPDARIIVLTTYSGDVQADRAFKAGAYGYLL